MREAAGGSTCWVHHRPHRRCTAPVLQVYDLLNALEERLGATSSAVVLAAAKAFLTLSLPLPATHQQVKRGASSVPRLFEAPSRLLRCTPAGSCQDVMDLIHSPASSGMSAPFRRC